MWLATSSCNKLGIFHTSTIVNLLAWRNSNLLSGGFSISSSKLFFYLINTIALIRYDCPLYTGLGDLNNKWNWSTSSPLDLLNISSQRNDGKDGSLSLLRSSIGYIAQPIRHSSNCTRPELRTQPRSGYQLRPAREKKFKSTELDAQSPNTHKYAQAPRCPLPSTALHHDAFSMPGAVEVEQGYEDKN